MSLKPCKECGKEISTEAKACPSCGASPPKKTSIVTWAIVLFVVVMITKSILGGQSDATPEVTAIVKTPQKIEAEAAQKKREDARFDLAYSIGKGLKKSLRDPDSLTWEFVGIDEAATVACIKYRAKNGFGGMNAEAAAIVGTKVLKSTADWNKYCTKPHLYDLTAAVT